ncbi:MAG: hypothetical protein ACRDQZ_20625 [Mycobacteriales bacterium]
MTDDDLEDLLIEILVDRVDVLVTENRLLRDTLVAALERLCVSENVSANRR